MRKIYLTICTDTADLRYPENPADIITAPADSPQIYAGEEVIFCCTFIGEDLQPVAFANTDTFDIGIDQNFDHSDDLMAYTNTFNQSGDWDDASPTAGKLSFRVSTATTAAAEKLANSASLQVKLEIRQFSSGSAAPSVLCQAPAIAHNTVIGTAPSAESAEIYATAAQLNAGLSAKLNKPASAGTAGQVLTLAQNGTTPEWSTPESGGGHTRWGTWEDRTPGTTYTAAVDGWIRIKIDAWDGDEVQLVVDGVEVFGTRMDWSSEFNYITGLVPVFSGQTYRSSASQVSELQFAPCV